MKELLKKKSVKISLLLIIFLVIMGIVGINARSAQRSKEYDAHIEAAEKYLSDLDYEQAIAEYTMAFEIDPKEEVVDALEQTYLAYAQTCIDAGDYEKAVGILEEGYEKIGRESLQNKIAELQAMQEEIRSQEAELQAQMQEIYERMAAEDYEGACRVVKNYNVLCGLLEELPEKKYIYFPEENGNMTGTGMGLYLFEYHGLHQDIACYYGNYVGGKREGTGVSINLVYSGGKNVFTGEWSNDAPNGHGEVIIYNYEGEAIYNTDSELLTVTRGNLVNGLWDGTVEHWLSWEGTSYEVSFTCDEGRPEDRTEEYLAMWEEGYRGSLNGIEGEREVLRNAGKYVYLSFTQRCEDGLTYVMDYSLTEGETLGIWEFATKEVVSGSKGGW